MVIFDTVIALSHNMDKTTWQLSQESKECTAEAVKLYKCALAEHVTLSGGYVDRKECSHAQMMRLYAADLGASFSHMLLEDTSLDTIGQVVFSKLHPAQLHNWEKIFVVSHLYHLPRVRAIFDFVYGTNFHLEYIPMYDSTVPVTKKMEEKEQQSMQLFAGLVKDIARANDKDLLSCLFERHEKYIPFKESRELFVQKKNNENPDISVSKEKSVKSSMSQPGDEICPQVKLNYSH